MDHLTFTSEPFEFQSDPSLSLQVARNQSAPCGIVLLHLEESKDRIDWVERWSGSVPIGETVMVPLQVLAGLWGRLRFEAMNGGGSVTVRGFRSGHGE